MPTLLTQATTPVYRGVLLSCLSCYPAYPAYPAILVSCYPVDLAVGGSQLLCEQQARKWRPLLILLSWCPAILVACTVIRLPFQDLPFLPGLHSLAREVLIAPHLLWMR